MVDEKRANMTFKVGKLYNKMFEAKDLQIKIDGKLELQLGIINKLSEKSVELSNQGKILLGTF